MAVDAVQQEPADLPGVFDAVAWAADALLLGESSEAAWAGFIAPVRIVDAWNVTVE